MNQEFLFKAARISHIHHLFRPFYSGMGSILMFHRVAKRNTALRIVKNRRNEVSPEFLELLVTYFLKNGYEIVSLDMLYDHLVNRKIQNKFVAFTFDDGYADAYSLAYPVFRKYAAPFTIYVSTNYPDKKAVLWWYLLEDLVLRNEEIRFTHDRKSYHFSSKGDQKDAAFHAIRTLIIRKSNDALESFMKDLFEPYGMNMREYSHKLSLDWNQIRIMSEDALVTIGAHTMNHYALSKLTREQAEHEIHTSREIIEHHIGKRVEHFSYPFGSRGEAGEREFEMVRNSGFKTATTTRIGNIFAAHRDHLECLPRIPVSGDREALFYIEAFTSGYISAMSNNFKKVITV
jgi:peptidoglycan/xylan/chitin deacetylase (PgdA/CDA1 family)